MPSNSAVAREPASPPRPLFDGQALPEFIIKTSYDGTCVEVDRAYWVAIRTGKFEFNGYNVMAEGTRFWPIEVTPVTDPDAPAEFTTIHGGRYNRAKPH